MIKFPKIKQLKDVIYELRRCPALTMSQLTFRGTVKLHGTNAGIHHTPEGEIEFQSRNNTLSISEDNMGFMNYFHPKVKELKKAIPKGYTVYGEWVGPGIQQGVGVNLLEEKKWLVFAVHNGENFGPVPWDVSGIVTVDYNIHIGVGVVSKSAGDYHFKLDLNNPDTSLLEQMTQDVEDRCPIAERFLGNVDEELIGEGLVWTCVEHPTNTSLWFKTKGEKHVKVSKKIRIPKEPERIEDIEAFVDFALTESRLQQGYQEVDGGSDSNIGAFLKWINTDVALECALDLQNSNLTTKDINKVMTKTAVQWYKKRSSIIN